MPPPYAYISFNPLLLHLVEILLPVGQVGRGVAPGCSGNGDQEVDATVAVVDVAPHVVRRLLRQLAQVNRDSGEEQEQVGRGVG